MWGNPSSVSPSQTRVGNAAMLTCIILGVQFLHKHSVPAQGSGEPALRHSILPPLLILISYISTFDPIFSLREKHTSCVIYDACPSLRSAMHHSFAFPSGARFVTHSFGSEGNKREKKESS